MDKGKENLLYQKIGTIWESCEWIQQKYIYMRIINKTSLYPMTTAITDPQKIS